MIFRVAFESEIYICALISISINLMAAKFPYPPVETV